MLKIITVKTMLIFSNSEKKENYIECVNFTLWEKTLFKDCKYNNSEI